MRLGTIAGMTSTWRSPGLRGKILYAFLASLLSAVVTTFSRIHVTHQRGRSGAVAALPEGKVIVVANHTSFADGILLALACRRLGRSLRLLGTAGVFAAPIVGPLLRRLGFIPVQRGSATAAESLTLAAAALQAGEAVGIFPEGRITRDPAFWPERGKTGAVRLAAMTGAPIVPVAIMGAHRLLDRKGNGWRLLKAFVLTPEVQVLVGEPIGVAPLVRDVDDEASIRAATDLMMARLTTALEQLRGEDSPVREAGVAEPHPLVSDRSHSA